MSVLKPGDLLAETLNRQQKTLELSSRNQMIAQLEKLIKEVLENDGEARASIEAVYLFGSYAADVAKDQSDLDFAFLFEEKYYRADPYQAFSLASLICAKIGHLLAKKTDVVALKSASLEMAYEIITTGKCIYERDPDARLIYEAKTIGLWLDFKPFLDRLRRDSLAAL